MAVSAGGVHHVRCDGRCSAEAGGPSVSGGGLEQVPQPQQHRPPPAVKPAKAGNGPRVRDASGYRRRAAGMCVRPGAGGGTELLLVSSVVVGKNHWIIPGGGVELGEHSCAAAVRECREEAGVVAHVLRYVGRFTNDERRHRTDVFVLHVDQELDRWHDNDACGRQRRWFAVAEAAGVLKESQRNYLAYLRADGIAADGQ